MTYRASAGLIIIESGLIDMTNSAAQLIGVTDPNMRLEVYDINILLVNVTSRTNSGAINIGVISSNYNDQLSASSLSSLTTANTFLSTNAGGSTAKSIAPNTSIYLKPSTVASASVFQIKAFVCGVYH